MSKKQPTNNPVNQAVTQTVQEPENAPELLDETFKGKADLIFLALAGLIGFIVFKDFLLFNKLFMFKDIGSDTPNFYYPNLIEYSRLVSEQGSVGWSFARGMGQNMYPNAYNDIFYVFLYMIGPKSLMWYIGWMEYAKVIIGGWLFLRFLSQIGAGSYTSVIGGLMYAFSGYMIIGGSWYFFSSSAVYLAFFFLAFEYAFQDKKYWLFALASGALSFYNPVVFFVSVIALAVFFLFRYFSTNEFEPQAFLKKSAILTALGLLGLSIGCINWLASVSEMLISPRGTGTASYAALLKSQSIFGTGYSIYNGAEMAKKYGDGSAYMATLFLRTMSNDLLGNGSKYMGWYNYLEAPMNYCGLFSLLFAPFAFLGHTKKAALYATVAFIAFWVGIQLFPWFRYAFWVFTGDYFRQLSSFSVIAFIVLGVMGLDRAIRQGKINIWVLSASFLFWILVLFYPYFKNSAGPANRIDSSIQLMTAIFLTGYLILGLLLASKTNRRIGQIGILVLCAFEVLYTSSKAHSNRDAITVADIEQRKNFNDYSLEAVELLKKQDSSFFRINKNYNSTPAIHGSLNDAMVQGYFATASYHSFNNINYINFLASIGAVDPKDEFGTRWAPGLVNSPVAQMLCGVKYQLIKGDYSRDALLKFAYDSLAKVGDVNILRSKNALPLGVFFDKYMTKTEFDKLGKDNVRKQTALLKAIVIEDNEVQNYKDLTPLVSDSIEPSSSLSFEKLAQLCAERKLNTLKITSFSNDRILGNVSLEKPEVLFLSFPHDVGWKASIDGVETPLEIVDSGLTALRFSGKGNHEVLLEYTPRWKSVGIAVSAIGLLLMLVLLAFEIKNKK